jgi:RecG-like helicase
MASDYLIDKIEKGLAITSKNEYLDFDILKEFNLLKEYETTRILHQPNNMEEIEKAKERLAFDKAKASTDAKLKEKQISKTSNNKGNK